ncbi:redoxin domain-containing protein [Halopenitus sp. H-Gu1]|uniref:redoxin domain-containing protein n=1 Tax=Halopenitus sp. H-Gu1 TaxID=3242697 RepID=UPI00359D8EFB
MVTTGDTAPDFEATRVGDDVEPMRLSDNLGDGPVVLAFFPAAFTGTCTTELCTLRDRLDRFEALNATVFGISTDLPYALSEFRTQEEFTFDLLSDAGHEAIAAYDVVDSFDHVGIDEIARRSVFVIDDGGTIVYRWLADEPGHEPPYDDVEAAVEEAAAEAT